MATAAARLLRKLDGLFAVYKPHGVHWKHVRDTVQGKLLNELNSSPAVPQCSVLHLQPLCPPTSPHLTITTSNLPALSHHPLVTGPMFHKIRVGVGHRLDAFSSGVLVLGLGNGNTALESLYRSHVTREYTLEGEFGIATDDFTHTGRIIERSTSDHVTADNLERVLAMIQGANQKALIMYSQVDTSTQEAYELAVKGLLRPKDKSPPILTALRCLHFNPPRFTLEVQCVNETQRFLRKLVHELGLELRTNAVCTKVRRTRDGPFQMDDALTHHRWSAHDIIPAIANFRQITRKIRKNDMSRRAVKASEPRAHSPNQSQSPNQSLNQSQSPNQSLNQSQSRTRH